MHKIILFMNTSFDLVIGGNNAESDSQESQNNDGVDAPSEEEHIYANQLFDSADTIAFGRITYQGFTEYWDNVDVLDTTKPIVETDFAKVFQQKNRVVFSQTLKQVPTNTQLISHDFINQVTQLKQQSNSDILLLCGSELVAALIELNLIDEIKLILSPNIYGKGHYLFGKLNKPINLKLLDLKKFSSGGILHHYKVNHK